MVPHIYVLRAGMVSSILAQVHSTLTITEHYILILPYTQL